VKQLRPQKNQGICMYHNPKMGIFCKNGSSCLYKHLDTNLPHLLRELNEAKAAKGFSDKGKSKGKGKGKNKQK